MQYDFHEYMNSRGKIEKPKVDASGDQIDPKTPPTSPKGGKPYAAKGGKGSKLKIRGGDGGEGFAGKGPKDLVYKPAEGGKKPKTGGVKGPKCCGGEGGEGFAGKGNKELIYKPSDNPKKVKIPTVEARTEMLPVLRESLNADPVFIQHVINELKQSNLLGVLVGELLEHRETYTLMAEVMSHPDYGPKVRRKLSLALEEVAEPFGKEVIASKPTAPVNDAPADEEDAEEAEGEEDPNAPAEEAPQAPVAPAPAPAPQMMRKW